MRMRLAWLKLAVGAAAVGLSTSSPSSVLFWGSEWLATFVPWRLHVDMPWERQLPFVPWTVWIYLSMDVLLLLAPLVLRTWRELLPLWLVLAGETVVAVAHSPC